MSTNSVFPNTQNRATGSGINPRVVLIDVGAVRALLGCPAETVVASVGNALHPKFLRWVFNLSANPKSHIRSLHFWKDEICGTVDKWAEPEIIIEKILGARKNFPRGEIENQWSVSRPTVMRWVKNGEVEEINHTLTRASLAEFLKRRLQ